VARDYGDGSANWYGNADSFADGASAPFGSGSAGTGTLSIYATYKVASELAYAGRATIAGTPSNGLSANYKRGSRFNLSEPGRLASISAYLDGNGGGTGSQKARLALYRDSSGTPGALVAESSEMTINAGRPAGWVTAGVPALMLDPGNYWIVVHSGSTAGIIRDFGDGANSWYGNADAYSDGASSSFGTGSAGTGTISATIAYIPASHLVTKTIGRTTVGTTPSKGLTSNVMRVADYSGSWVEVDGATTAFWAYLDGNGGASGTQDVRVVLYGTDGYHDPLGYKLIESDVVTIAAGRPPGWVRFPIRAPITFTGWIGYWIGLQSGDTTGVVRDYADGTRQWSWIGDSFADGANEFIDRDPNQQYGAGELSVYLEYTEPPQ
jgi:hypothetical protein